MGIISGKNQYIEFFEKGKNKKRWKNCVISEENLKECFLFEWLEEIYCTRKGCKGCPFEKNCQFTYEYIDANKNEANCRKGFIAQEDFIIVACIAEDTLINTEQGLIPIQEVRKLDKVYTEQGLKTVENVFLLRVCK